MPVKVPKRVLSARELILQVMGEEAALRFDSAVARNQRHRVTQVTDEDLAIAGRFIEGKDFLPEDGFSKQRIVGALNVVLRKVVFENDKIRTLVLRQIGELQSIVTEVVRENDDEKKTARTGKTVLCPVCGEMFKAGPYGLPVHLGRTHDKDHKAYKKANKANKNA